EVVTRRAVVGGGGRRALEHGHRLERAAFQEEEGAELPEGVRVARVLLQDLAEVHLRRQLVAEPGLEDRDADEHVRALRIEGQGLPKCRERLGISARPEGDEPPRELALEVLRSPGLRQRWK